MSCRWWAICSVDGYVMCLLHAPFSGMLLCRIMVSCAGSIESWEVGGGDVARGYRPL